MFWDIEFRVLCCACFRSTGTCLCVSVVCGLGEGMGFRTCLGLKVRGVEGFRGCFFLSGSRV